MTTAMTEIPPRPDRAAPADNDGDLRTDPDTTPAPDATVHTVVTTALGELTLVRRGTALVGVYFPGHWTRPDPARWGRRLPDGDAAGAGFADVVDQLEEYLAGGRRTFSLELDLVGTASQRRIWALLQQIPYGGTVTYGDLARQTGTDPRAVGGAVGANPVSIVVPCHRVVGADGSLTGYAGGLDRKRRLLDLESDVSGGPTRLF